MSKTLSDQIVALHSEMKFLALCAGVKPEKYARLIESIGHAEVDHLDQLYDFLVKLKENEWLALSKIRYAMHIDEGMWQMYDIMPDAHIITEVRLFRDASNKFRKAFKFKYKKPEETYENQSECGKSESEKVQSSDQKSEA